MHWIQILAVVLETERKIVDQNCVNKNTGFTWNWNIHKLRWQGKGGVGDRGK